MKSDAFSTTFVPESTAFSMKRIKISRKSSSLEIELITDNNDVLPTPNPGAIVSSPS